MHLQLCDALSRNLIIERFNVRLHELHLLRGAAFHTIKAAHGVLVQKRGLSLALYLLSLLRLWLVLELGLRLLLILMW
jgi:hypothetical protein